MTSPDAKMPSPGWVPLPVSPASSCDTWSPSQGPYWPAETKKQWFFSGRWSYQSPPKSPRKKIKMETSDDTVWSGLVVPESPVMTRIKKEADDDDFTPRCTMERTLKVQQEHLRALSFNTHNWESLAAMLSPPPKKTSTHNHNLLPPNPLPHNHFERPKNAYTGCLCISCAGPAKAKPQVAACAVCAAQIPYSVCVASNRKPTTPTTVPNMCFACMRAFE